MRDCWSFLDLTSRSFAAVIKELDGDLARVVRSLLILSSPSPIAARREGVSPNVQMLIIVVPVFSTLRSACSTSPFEVSTPSRTT